MPTCIYSRIHTYMHDYIIQAGPNYSIDQGQWDNGINLQANKLFIVASATLGGWLPPPRFSVRFKILYRVIQPLIQHCLLSTMVYLNVKYNVIDTRSYEFFIYSQNLIGNITLSRVIISVASAN